MPVGLHLGTDLLQRIAAIADHRVPGAEHFVEALALAVGVMPPALALWSLPTPSR